MNLFYEGASFMSLHLVHGEMQELQIGKTYLSKNNSGHREFFFFSWVRTLATEALWPKFRSKEVCENPDVEADIYNACISPWK